MKNTKNALFIILAVIAGSVALSLVDGVIRPEYIFKCMAKATVFLLIPLLYLLLNKKSRPLFRSLFKPTKKAVITAAILGGGVFSVVMGAYLLLCDYIDFSAFTDNLSKTAGLTKSNFFIVFPYICIINSFMEELFFRGLAFLFLKVSVNRIFAYAFSSLAFALYHTGMTGTLVAPWVFILMLLGLFLGGIIFCFVDEKAESILPSWLCHMLANLATCTIGLILLSK